MLTMTKWETSGFAGNKIVTQQQAIMNQTVYGPRRKSTPILMINLSGKYLEAGQTLRTV